jgi:protein required for attachment to host cells
MAVFSALQRGFFQSCALDVPVENDLVVHEAPYLVPLLRAFYQQRESLVVLTDTHRGRLYAATPGSVRLLQEIDEEVPSRQHSAGERWGKEQATIARHREDRILHYLKDLVELVEKTWAEHPFGGLVLRGEPEVLEHFRKRLPPRLAGQVVHEGPQTWTEKPLAIDGEVRAILTGALRAREEYLLEDLQHRLREGYPVAIGPGEVLEALEKGRIGPRGRGYLLFGPDPRELVGRCSVCRSLWLEVPDACPRCQAPCVEASLWEELLLLALRHDLTAHFVRSDPELARCGGVVAVLPRQEPGAPDHSSRTTDH